MIKQNLKMAWRNVMRHRKRSLMAVTVVALGYFAMSSMAGFALFSYQSLAQFSAESTGHVTIHHKDYYDGVEENPLQNGMENWEPLYKQVLQDDKVRMVVPHVIFSGLLSNGEKSEIFMGDGTTVNGMRAQALSIQLVDGRPFAKTSDDMEIMVGVDMLKNINMQVGDLVTVLAADVDGVLNALDAYIVGVVDTGVPAMNARFVATNYKYAQDLMGTDKISHLSVLLNETDLTETMMQQLDSQNTGFGTTHWEDLAFFYKGVKSLYNNLFGFMAFLIVLVVFVSISNVVTMSVVERMKEIGTLRAMGAYPSRVVSGFVSEGVIVALLGSFIGMILAVGVYLFLTVAGIEMPAAPGQTRPYPLMIAINGTILSVASGILIFVCFLASFVASRLGVRKPIVEALSDA